MSVLKDVRTYFPQLRDLPDEAVRAAIKRSGHYVHTAQWGGSVRADYARALLVAHFLTAPTGPVVSSRSGGGISETYALTEGDAWLSSTVYGTEFLALQRRTVPARFRIAPVPHGLFGPWRGGWGGGYC